MIWRTLNPNLGRSMGNLNQLQSRLHQIFDKLATPSPRKFPAINGWMDQNHLKLAVELPGVDPHMIEIDVKGDLLTLKGARATNPADSQTPTHFYLRERDHGPFERTIQLPFAVDSEQVQATYDKGILTIEIQKPKALTARKIPVKQA